MRPKTLIPTVKALMARGKNVIIEGSPGLGKTVSVKEAARQLGDEYVVIFKHGPTMQPEDLALPFKNHDTGRLDFARASWIPLAGDYEDDKHVVVVIDELPQASNDVQKSLANIMQEREAYGLPLHPNTSFICTGNRAKDRAGANRILSHLRNRMITLSFDPNIDDWSEWAVKNDVPAEIISFLRFKSSMLNAFDPSQEISPTPRAWSENVADILRDVRDGVIPAEVETESYAGAVGEGAATEFKTFLTIWRELPDMDLVLKEAATYNLPTKPSILYALCGSLAMRADKDNMDAISTIVERLGDMGKPEFGVMVMIDISRRDPSLQTTKGFTRWAVKAGNVLV